jgi:hypothetical protein
LLSVERGQPAFFYFCSKKNVNAFKKNVIGYDVPVGGIQGLPKNKIDILATCLHQGSFTLCQKSG